MENQEQTHESASVIVKSILDLGHGAFTVFFGVTSWATLYPGLSQQYTASGAVALCLLTNIMFDLLPFTIGSEVSEQIAAGKHWRQMKSMIASALILHAISGCITFFGATIAASFIVSDTEIQALTQKYDNDIAAIQSENERRRAAYELEVSKERRRRDDQIADLNKAHENTLAKLENQSWAVRRDSVEKSRIARQMRDLNTKHEKQIAAILAEPVIVQKPVMKKVESRAGELAGELAEKKQVQQRNVAIALKVTDISLYICTVLWFLVIVHHRQFAGRSMILNVVGFGAYMIRAIGVSFGAFVEFIEFRVGQWRSPRERRMMIEIDRMTGKIESYRGRIEKLIQTIRDRDSETAAVIREFQEKLSEQTERFRRREQQLKEQAELYRNRSEQVSEQARNNAEQVRILTEQLRNNPPEAARNKAEPKTESPEQLSFNGSDWVVTWNNERRNKSWFADMIRRYERRVERSQEKRNHFLKTGDQPKADKAEESCAGYMETLSKMHDALKLIESKENGNV